MRIIYDKIKDGGPISNSELNEAIDFFSDLEDKLMVLGPVFRLAWKEALNIKITLESFKRAREEQG